MKVESTENVEDNWWNDLTDDNFQKEFRMSKKTLINLQAEIDHCEFINEDRIDNVLLASVWFLGNTKSFEDVENLFHVDDTKETIRTYLLSILKLGSLYVLWPDVNEAKLVQNGFAAEYKFPGVIGVIGSLHIEVNVTGRGDSGHYYNHIMDKHTIVLQIVCDNNNLLRDVCVGCPGGQTIKSILVTSPLFTRLNETVMSENNLHVLGGTEHPESSNLLTPYKLKPGQLLTEEQCKFNLLHTSVMCAVECTFRCMENRFPRLTSVEDLEPEYASIIASCVCVLHNFTRVRNDHSDLYN